jgi:hypothetical protein
MKTKHFLFVSLLVLAVLLSACGPAVAPATVDSNSLNVSGSGTVYLAPNIARIYVGVHTEDADIAKALEKNNAQAQTVVNALTAMGVALEDIQTSNFNIWSMEDYDDVGQAYTKYTVDNNVYVTVRDLSKLGKLLSTVVSSGANNINSINFDVADKTAAMAQARQLAMANASTLAAELAQTAGLSLDGIKNITYSDYSPSPYYGMGGGAAPEAMSSVPIQPGQLEISVSVNVTYGIK